MRLCEALWEALRDHSSRSTGYFNDKQACCSYVNTGANKPFFWSLEVGVGTLTLAGGKFRTRRDGPTTTSNHYSSILQDRDENTHPCISGEVRVVGVAICKYN